jgi:streptogrisin C
VSGELCSWQVQWPAAGNYTYTTSGEVARHVWLGEKRGHCIIAGDSGGPVYTVDSSNRVVAKGIISGATGYGGSDHNTGALEPPCRNIFTDIWDAYFGFPGDIN